ncbi:MAG: 3-oxoacyl-ACP synthase [Sulfurifustaceae bacterium]
MTTRLYLHGCRYVVGEEERRVDDIPGLAGFLARNQMANEAALWGWGRYRVSSMSAPELAVEVARRTLDDFADARREVDAVVICAAGFSSEVDGHADIVGRFLENVGLPHAIPYGVILNRCATLLSGLSLAQALIGSGRHRSVLVVASDTAAEDGQRLRPFAVFSDGAASCVISAAKEGEYELIATAAAVNAGAMKPNGEISGDLGREANARLFAGTGIATDDVRFLAHNNLFKPIIAMKEQQAGFRRDQLFLDNIPRLGHVFTCDPMINLIDLAAAGRIPRNAPLVLGSSVSGARFAALMRKT